MAFIESKHTLAAIERIKKELSIFAVILSIGSMVIFSIYYGYLIFTNILVPVYLIAYIILFVLVIVTFVIEMILKVKRSDDRKTVRIKAERKRFISIFTKSLKYLAKTSTVVLALYGSLINNNSDLKTIMSIVSCVTLGIQLLFEFILCFVNRYIDYLKIGFELDFDSSLVTKVFLGKQLKVKKLEKKVYGLKGDSFYTEQETKIINMLVEDADKLKQEREQQLKLRIQTSKQEIKKLTDVKLKPHVKEKLEKKYEIAIVEAKELLASPEKIDKLLIKAEELCSKLPGDVAALKYIPEFLSLLNNYVAGKYKDISVTSVIAVVAVIIYFVSPFDIIPDILPVVGYFDEAYVIGLCLNTISDELEKFLIWRRVNGNI